MLGGIDEAGRGPVLGPLVVAGVAVLDPALPVGLGCRDSKMLTPAKRESIARRLATADGVRIEVRVFSAEQLDALRERRTLNDLEVEAFRDIASCLGATTLIVDAADVDAERFGRRVRHGLPAGVTVVSEHKADTNHPIVGAASIVAKVERDRHIAELARRLERRLDQARPMGSGYPSDPLTVAFLKAWVERFGDLPDGTRRTWAPARLLMEPKAATLDQF